VFCSPESHEISQLVDMMRGHQQNFSRWLLR
jgi:hypothetical protein